MADDSEKYFLGREKEESERLKKQSSMASDIFGYNLHPIIVSRLPPEAVIGDIATGTGIFLTDLAKQLPSSCTFHGFDISPAQFPDVAEKASNVHFHLVDAKKPYPQEWHGKFDVICLRALVAAMDDSDWSLVAANAIQLLKPGGMIQWGEGNWGGVAGPLRMGSVATDLSETRAPNLDTIFTELQRLIRVKERQVEGAFALPIIFREAGLTNVFTDAVASDWVVRGRGSMTENLIDIVVNGLKMMKVRGEMEFRGDIGELQKGALAEIEKGWYIRIDLHITIAIKE